MVKGTRRSRSRRKQATIAALAKRASHRPSWAMDFLTVGVLTVVAFFALCMLKWGGVFKMWGMGE